MIKRLLNDSVFWFLFASFCLSQVSLLYRGIYVDKDMRPFYTMSGDVEWWVRVVSYKLQIVWLATFAIYLGLRRERLSVKTAIQIGIYFFTGLKDIYDWVLNGNRDIPYVDWIITVVLLIAIELLWSTIPRYLRKEN